MCFLLLTVCQSAFRFLIYHKTIYYSDQLQLILNITKADDTSLNLLKFYTLGSQHINKASCLISLYCNTEQTESC